MRTLDPCVSLPRRRVGYDVAEATWFHRDTRNQIDFDQWMQLDLEYIDSWSPMLDLKILLRTIPAVLSGRGAS